MSDADVVFARIQADPNLTPADRTTIAEALGMVGYTGHDISRVSGRTYPAQRTGALDKEPQR